ncbi:hypothetical protein [Microbacterium sp. A1-JK]|uniref:hypothetical protein n=1 Tax=Microbacterium sp. A1-JK TaxID=3177516 RepID=UPI00388A1F0D
MKRALQLNVDLICPVTRATFDYRIGEERIFGHHETFRDPGPPPLHVRIDVEEGSLDKGAFRVRSPVDEVADERSPRAVDPAARCVPTRRRASENAAASCRRRSAARWSANARKTPAMVVPIVSKVLAQNPTSPIATA